MANDKYLNNSYLKFFWFYILMKKLDPFPPKISCMASTNSNEIQSTENLP